MAARGQIAEGQVLRAHSLIGGQFEGRIVGRARVGDHAAVLPEISGRAWITGMHQHMLDPADPWPEGYRLSDTWGARGAARQTTCAGPGLMVASMAGFAVEDVFLKAAARHLPLGQVMIVMGLCGVAVFARDVAAPGRTAISARGGRAPVMLARSAAEMAGRLFYALAVALTPLSSASAILQATPLVVIAGAALMFGEKVGAARWLAVASGLCRAC